MKTINLKKALMMICCVALFSVACKKATSDDLIPDEPTQARVQSDDAALVQGETESVDDDVSGALSSSAKFSGDGNVFAASSENFSTDMDTTNVGNNASRTIITYSGTLNGCRKRTGTITIDLLNAHRWIMPGATIRIKFTNYKVENVCTNRSVTINGERFLTNVYGGNRYTLKKGISALLKHRVRTGAFGIEAKFTDSSGIKTAVWNVAKLTQITFNTIPGTILGKYNFSINGDTTINGRANTESWGTTRFGTPYQTVFTSPIQANTVCKLWKPTSGEVKHHTGSHFSMVNFGLNSNGLPVGAGDCATHFRVSWTNLANPTSATNTVLLMYR